MLLGKQRSIADPCWLIVSEPLFIVLLDLVDPRPDLKFPFAEDVCISSNGVVLDQNRPVGRHCEMGTFLHIDSLLIVLKNAVGAIYILVYFVWLKIHSHFGIRGGLYLHGHLADQFDVCLDKHLAEPATRVELPVL